MTFLAIAIIICTILWALIVSTWFRWAAFIAVAALVVWIMSANEQEKKAEQAKALETQRADAEAQKRAEELWTKIKPNQVELRGLTLSPSRNDEEFELTGSIKNLAGDALGELEIEILLKDCVGKNCEIVGRTVEGVWVNVPPGEVRGINRHVVKFSQLPDDPKGILTPTFAVKRIFAGDLFERMSLSRN